MTRVYDLVMTHKLDADDLFIHRVQLHCAELGLNFFLVEPLWVQQFHDLTLRKQIWSRVLLNMHSEHHLPDDIYHRLVLLADRQGTRVIDPPEVAQAAFDKARMHARLMEAGMPAPFTIAVPHSGVADFRLSERQIDQLGLPFVIKPSHGYGRRGVVLDARSEQDLLRSVSAWPNPGYLLQQLVVPGRVGDRPAYWRVFYVFGEVFICWWDCFTDQYSELAEGDVTEVQAWSLRELMLQIARMTGMSFFSSEIARMESGDLMLIDYVNDQCHMLSQSADPNKGVPDKIVCAIARRLTSAARDLIERSR